MIAYALGGRLFEGTTIVFLLLSGTAARAQSPTMSVPLAARAHRAREACAATAARYGYHVMQHDSARTRGTTYELPLHVTHGASEADVTCRYDIERGTAALPAWDERTGQPAHTDTAESARRESGKSRVAFIARQECQNYINSRPGFRVQRVGTPVDRGMGQWDVPLTARQDGHTDIRATCRYIRATGTVSLRPR